MAVTQRRMTAIKHRTDRYHTSFVQQSPLNKPTRGPDDFRLITQVGLLTGKQIFATFTHINETGYGYKLLS